jgi:hypothetical protein
LTKIIAYCFNSRRLEKKTEDVLADQGIIDSLAEDGRRYGMDTNVQLSRQSTSVRVMIDQKQVRNV